MATVDRIIKILQALLDYKEAVSIAELSSMTGIKTSILYRYISPLRKEGYICKLPKSTQYMIGPKFLEFSNLARGTLSIDRAAYFYMAKLHNLIDETIQLATLDKEVAVCNLIIHGTQRLRVVMGENAELPLYCTGVGKIFLAYMKKSKLENYLTNLKSHNNHFASTIPDVTEFNKSLLKIKEEGIAIDQEEFIPGIVEIAAPIKNWKEQLLAAIGILIPSSRAKKNRIPELTALLKRTALDISIILNNP